MTGLPDWRVFLFNVAAFVRTRLIPFTPMKPEHLCFLLSKFLLSRLSTGENRRVNFKTQLRAKRANSIYE